MTSETTIPAGISFITLGVSDLERSRRFYESIGFVVHPRSNQHVAFFDLSGLIFALFPRQALAADAAGTPGEVDGVVSSLSRNVGAEKDVMTLLELARDAGGRILRTPSAPPWGGIRGYFADPDGFIWEVAWNPHVDVLSDGRVRW